MHKQLIACLLFFSCTVQAFNPEEATIAEFHQALANGTTSCVAHVDWHLRQIKRYNFAVNSKPPLNAFVSLSEELLLQAKVLDNAYARIQQPIGPLHCVPVVVKDNIDTENIATTVGSFSMLGSQANSDAKIIQSIKEKGGIIIGKTTMDEFASGIFGIGSRFGRTGNAFDTTQSPGGSSSGSAVAVSSNFAMLGIGTDNSGSLRIPAAFNGIYTIRPTYDVVSDAGVFPRGTADAAIGPMARTMRDTALFYEVLRGTPANQINLDYLQTLSVADKRIGVLRTVGDRQQFSGANRGTQDIYNQAINTFRQIGFVIVEDVTLPEFNNERKDNTAGDIELIDDYLASFPSTRKSFSDICESDRTRTFGDSVEACLNFMDTNATLNGDEHKAVLAMITQNRQYVEKFMQENNLTALITPVYSFGAPAYDIAGMNAPVASNAGLPSATIIAGYDGVMPVGMELIGPANSDRTLLALAYMHEQAFGPRKQPVLNTAARQYDVSDWQIYQLNNLVTLLGANSYDKILKTQEPEALSAALFMNIATETIGSQINN